MTSIDTNFEQFRGMAENSWHAKDLVTEMFAKKWIVQLQDSAWAIDRKATTSKTLDLLLSHLSLFEKPKFVTYFERVIQKLDPYNENKAVFAPAKKSACAYLLQCDIPSLPAETRAFLLQEAIVQKDAEVLIRLLRLLPHSGEVTEVLNSNLTKLQSLMRSLIEQDLVEVFETLFEILASCNLQIGYHYNSLILCKNPYCKTQSQRATEPQLLTSEAGNWTKVELVIEHNNQYYKVKINIETKKLFEGWQEATRQSAMLWIDQGFPDEPTRFGSCFSWSPTIEQFGSLLKGNPKEFNNRMVWYLQKSGYLALVVHHSAVTNEELKRYVLESPYSHFEKYEIRFIFERIGTMDLDMATHFFKLIVSKEFSMKKKVAWMKRLLAVYPNLIALFNHKEQRDNLPLVYIAQRKWELAQILLSAGWDPTKCPDGAAVLERTLIEMAAILENETPGNPFYKNEELNEVEEIIPFLCRFIPVVEDMSQFTYHPPSVKTALAHKILSHVLCNGRHTDKVLWLEKVYCRYPDLLLFIARQHPETITSDRMRHHLWAYLRLSEAGLMQAIMKLIEMGCPIDATDYRNPFKKLLRTLRNHKKRYEPIDHGLCLALFDKLTRRDFDFNRRVEPKAKGLPSMTYIEKFYMLQKLPLPLCFDLLERMTLQGALITPGMARRIKLELKSFAHPGLTDCLKKQGYLQDWEIVQTPSDLLIQAQNAISWLESESTKSYLLVSLVTFGKIRKLKKELKVNQHNPHIQAAYRQLSSAYDAFVLKHLLLTELRAISQRLRVGDKPKEDVRVVRLYALWGPEISREYKSAAKGVRCLKGPSRQAFWSDIVEHIYEANDKTIKANLYNKGQIVWFHGTKFSSIPPIQKDNGIIPMGQIYAKGSVSFAGELCGSHDGENKDKLSGYSLTPSWDRTATEIYDAATRFLVSYLYATKNSGYGSNEKYFDPVKALERLTLECTNERERWPDMSATLMADILRIRMTSPNADVQLQPVKEFVNRQSHSRIQELNHALTVQLAYTYTPEECIQLQRKEPVVFASLTVDTIQSPTQFYVSGKQELGKDIQVAFTEQTFVSELQDMLRDRGIEVFPFEVAFYLETMQMISGSRNLAMRHLPLEQRIASALKWDILPRYTIPFPEGEDNRNYAPGCTSYEEYRKKVEKGLVLPRTIHGAVHASRVALWTLLFYRLYREQHPKVASTDPFMLALTGACHDIARRDEGEDLWDRESSQFLKSYLQAQDYTSQEIAPFAHAIAEKDPAGNNFKTWPQLCVHDADVVEIIRVLRDKSEFRMEELQFPKYIKIEETTQHALLDELFSFIAWTEREKWQLEHSDDLFSELLQMLQKKRDTYTLITNILRL